MEHERPDSPGDDPPPSPSAAAPTVHPGKLIQAVFSRQGSISFERIRESLSRDAHAAITNFQPIGGEFTAADRRKIQILLDSLPLPRPSAASKNAAH